MMSEINPQYFLSILASAFGCSLFYVYLTVRVGLIEYFKSLFGCIAFGVIALAVAESFYPANSEMINIAVIPFFSGMSMPQIFRGYAKLLYKFSQEPTEQLNMFAKLYNTFKGKDPKENTTKEEDSK
jgi:hypothetical protein